MKSKLFNQPFVVLMDKKSILNLYSLMFRSRYFEESVKKLWNDGYIFGEMHTGIGEEGIIAGIVSHLIPGDAIATDHRSTPPFIMRGIDQQALLLELLGHKQGICSGMGGHMHLFSKELMLTSSGIVGSSAPSAVGFAIAAKYKKSNNIAVAFFGEGSMNQGMLLESLNLASAWNLPVLFVCKDNNWAITTQSDKVTGGSLIKRVEGFGIKTAELNGSDTDDIWYNTKEIMTSIRKKKNPFFIHAKCIHKDGHFLGDPLFRFHSSPIKEFSEVTGPLTKAVLSTKGTRLYKRIGEVKSTLSLINKSRAQRKDKYDPIHVTRKKYKEYKDEIIIIEEKIKEEIDTIVDQSLSVLKQEERV